MVKISVLSQVFIFIFIIHYRQVCCIVQWLAWVLALASPGRRFIAFLALSISIKTWITLFCWSTFSNIELNSVPSLFSVFSFEHLWKICSWFSILSQPRLHFMLFLFMLLKFSFAVKWSFTLTPCLPPSQKYKLRQINLFSECSLISQSTSVKLASELGEIIFSTVKPKPKVP